MNDKAPNDDARTDNPPEIPGQESLPGTPPATPDEKPKRPTTRAGRAAAKAERDRQRAAGGTSTRKPRERKPSSPGARKSPLVGRLENTFSGIGVAVMGAGAAMGSEPVKADGIVVIHNAKPIAEALDRVAANDPKVREALERMLTVGVYGQLMAALAPVIMGIAANHGVIGPELATMASGLAASGDAPDAPAGGAAPTGRPL